MATLPDEAADVVSFWLGSLDSHGLASPDMQRRWWTKDPAFDEEVRRRFEPLHRQLTISLPDSWCTPRGRLAAILVWDQFSRNMFRDTPRMFGSDGLALAAARTLVDAGQDQGLATHERMFVYMPFMHSEALIDQTRCVALFRLLRDQSEGPAREAIEGNLRFAFRHEEIVRRFGRFPHRNRLLGRESTPEERAFLQQPGSSF